MDQKQLQETLETTLKEVLPWVVDATVDAKMDEKVSNLENAIADLNKSIKMWVDEEKENVNEAKKAMWKFFKALAKCHNDAEVAQVKATYLNEWTDAEGWYMVPVEFAREVFRIAGDAGIVRKYARIIPMWTDTKNISTITNSIVAYWTDEGEAYTWSKPTVWQCQLVAYKVTALVSATNELIEDNMTDQEVWTLMSELIGEKIAEFEDENVLVASSKFTSLLANTNVNITTMWTWEEFANISYDDLIDVVRSVPMKYKKGQPRWFMSQDIVKYIEKLKDNEGQPIFFATRSIRDWQLENFLLWYPLEDSRQRVQHRNVEHRLVVGNNYTSSCLVEIFQTFDFALPKWYGFEERIGIHNRQTVDYYPFAVEGKSQKKDHKHKEEIDWWKYQ